MALGGIVVFRERFNAWQWLGLAVIVIGLSLFFADQLRADTLPAGRYVLGSLIVVLAAVVWAETEEHTSELQSLMRISYAVFCLKKKKNDDTKTETSNIN